MKTKLIIAGWLISLALLFTNSIIQALVALVWFGISCYLMNKHLKAVTAEVNKFNKYIDKIINERYE